LRGAITGYVVAGAIILAAAPFLAKAADDLAERSGLGGTFFGTTFVALCTSLPEVVTTIAAVRMKAFDLAIGNIFGSNCFNMLIFLPLDFVDRGSLLSSVSQTHVYTALAVIVVTIAVILGQLYPAERKKHFLEPDALMTLVLILGALTGLYFLR
jgi:cation:H+ antiporter